MAIDIDPNDGQLGNGTPPPRTSLLTGNRQNTASVPSVEFSVSNLETVFAPSAYPVDVVVSKTRNKSREDNYCDGETVEDTGSKNREILVEGYIPSTEKAAFDRLLDEHGDLDLLAEEWSGEVQVLDGEYSKSGINTYRYTLNLVSTGLDEASGKPGDGILRGGEQ